MRTRLPLLTVVSFSILGMPALASDLAPGERRDPWVVDWQQPELEPRATAARIWQVDWAATTRRPAAASLTLRLPAPLAFTPDEQVPPSERPRVVELSDGYHVRLKIHRLASWATIPLFVTQYVLGDKLYDGTGSGSVRTAHVTTAVGVASLFGVNTITGVWNLWEARKDPNRRARRLVHGLLMLGADAGFVATGLLAPGDGGGDRETHRAVAITSMGVATASYLFMLLTR